MAEEHTNKAPECESNVGGEGAVETKDRGLFDFLGKKEEKSQEEVVATEFESKVKIEETKVEGEKKHTLLEKLHRSDSSSSSSSDEEEGEEGEKKKKKEKKKGLKEKIDEKLGGEKKEEIKHEDTTVPVEKCDEVVHPESAEKKGFLEKIKEKLPGQQKKAEEVPPPPPPAECFAAEPHEAETKEKKGILEKIKEKLPGYHSKTEEEKEKEKQSASH
ncbi:hypothetical protein CRYUN_Cryun35bG0005800 [Craigia yunnanensis]